MGDSGQLNLRPLALPGSLDDLVGLVGADLDAIVTMLTDRASQTLLLSMRQRRQLRCELWNRLVDSVNDVVAALDVENR
ncbi:MAG: hypothetical protein KatS3mg108_1161 [Isosphaeraceae bacterium]|jgi:hypothetical protein|nr:MAG: hypothetical protein KatS3mg108_1161 [Isosphaeraceae bacterium]